MRVGSPMPERTRSPEGARKLGPTPPSRPPETAIRVSDHRDRRAGRSWRARASLGGRQTRLKLAAIIRGARLPGRASRRRMQRPGKPEKRRRRPPTDRGPRDDGVAAAIGGDPRPDRIHAKSRSLRSRARTRSSRRRRGRSLPRLYPGVLREQMERGREPPGRLKPSRSQPVPRARSGRHRRPRPRRSFCRVQRRAASHLASRPLSLRRDRAPMIIGRLALGLRAMGPPAPSQMSAQARCRRGPPRGTRIRSPHRGPINATPEATLDRSAPSAGEVATVSQAIRSRRVAGCAE